MGRFASRRKSVFTETYNPEEDEEDEGVKVPIVCFCINGTGIRRRVECRRRDSSDLFAYQLKRSSDVRSALGKRLSFRFIEVINSRTREIETETFETFGKNPSSLLRLDSQILK